MSMLIKDITMIEYKHWLLLYAGEKEYSFAMSLRVHYHLFHDLSGDLRQRRTEESPSMDVNEVLPWPVVVADLEYTY